MSDDTFAPVRNEAGAARWAVGRRVALATLAAACGSNGDVFITRITDEPQPEQPAPLCTQTDDWADMTITTSGAEGTATAPDNEAFELTTWGYASLVTATRFHLTSCTGGDVDCTLARYPYARTDSVGVLAGRGERGGGCEGDRRDRETRER